MKPSSVLTAVVALPAVLYPVSSEILLTPTFTVAQLAFHSCSNPVQHHCCGLQQRLPHPGENQRMRELLISRSKKSKLKGKEKGNLPNSHEHKKEEHTEPTRTSTFSHKTYTQQIHMNLTTNQGNNNYTESESGSREQILMLEGSHPKACLTASWVSDPKLLTASNTHHKVSSPKLKLQPCSHQQRNSPPPLQAICLTAVVSKYPMIWQQNFKNMNF